MSLLVLRLSGRCDVNRAQSLKILSEAIALASDKSVPTNAEQAWQRLCSSAVIDPSCADAFVHIGLGCSSSGQLPTAIAAWRRILELPVGKKPGDATVQMKRDAGVDLANRLHHCGRNREAREIIHGLLTANKEDGKAWTNLSLVDSVEGKLDHSLQAAKLGLDLDHDSCTAQLAYAFALLYKRHFAEGLRHFESRFPYRFPQYLTYPYPKWNGERGDVWVVAEQGIGDTLSFARFVEPAAKRAKRLRLAVQTPVYRLLTQAFAHLSNVTVDPLPQPFPPAEYWSSFVSLPVALGLNDLEIVSAPHIAVPPIGMSTTWKADRKFHIGVSWYGSPQSDINHWRSFPFTELLRLYDVPGVQLYSLQLGDRTKDLYEAGAAGFVRDMSPYISDVLSTLAIVKELDLVVTTESLIGHICGLANVPCWIPYSYMGRDYRAGHDGSDPIWYSRHRFFKQDETMRWGPVFDRIVEALAKRVEGESWREGFTPLGPKRLVEAAE